MPVAFAAFIICMGAISSAQDPDAEFYKPEIPDNFTVDCVEKNLTRECGVQIVNAINTRDVYQVDDRCCRRIVINTSKQCWEKIYAPAIDDPCHFFRFIVARCNKVVGIASDPSDDKTRTRSTIACIH